VGLVGFFTNRVRVHEVSQFQCDDVQLTELQFPGCVDQDLFRIGLHLVAEALRSPGDHRHVRIADVAVGERLSRQRQVGQLARHGDATGRRRGREIALPAQPGLGRQRRG
jgi:hypothetical protein